MRLASMMTFRVSLRAPSIGAPDFPRWPIPVLLLAVLVGNLAYVAWACPFDLAPDEAHYWDWSRRLDWCYYSKGPLVALLIRGSCELFGHSAFAVRFPAVVSGVALLAGMAKLAHQVTGDRRFAFLVVAAASTLPGITAAGLLMTIDAPFLACWAWAAVCVQSALFRCSGDEVWLPWCLAGLLVAIGLLAKLTMLAFPVGVALLLIQQHRHRTRMLVPFLLIAGLGLIPMLVWNLRQDGVGLLHALGHSGHADPWPGFLGPVAFLGGQFGLLLGVWFIAWLRAMVTLRPANHPRTALLWWLSAPLFAICCFASVRTLGQPNWPAAAYVTGFVLAMVWTRDHWSSRAVRRAVVFALVLGLGCSVYLRWPGSVRPALAAFAATPTEDRPAPVRHFDPTARLHGWSDLANEVDSVREGVFAETGEQPLIAGMTWTVPGELGFYCRGNPRVYSFGLALADRFSQYDLWRPNPVLDAQDFGGRTFVYIGEALPEGAFDRMEPVRTVTPTRDGVPVASWKIWIGRGFRGFGPLAERGHPLRY